MAIEFNGSKKDREMEALDVLFKGKSDEYKGRIYDYIRHAKVDANDPTFLLMAALGNLDVALIDLPKEIEASGKKSSTEITKMISDLRTLLHKAATQAQEQVEAMNGTERRIQQALDTFKVRVSETLAALKHYRDESYEILKVSRESYQRIVNDSHNKNAVLLGQFESLGKQLEEERTLRMEKPWRNAVNLPPLILGAVIVGSLIIGMLIGSNSTNRTLASIEQLQKQIYNTFEKPTDDAIKKFLIEQENKKSRKKNRG